MKKSSFSILLFGIYLAGLSIAFIFFPNTFITLFGFNETTEVWIRILGYILGVLSFYFLMATVENIVAFYRWTIYARLMTLPTFSVFVFLDMAPPALLLFGTVDALSAIWTGLMLIQEHRKREPTMEQR